MAGLKRGDEMKVKNTVRLDKLLANAGYGSRKEIKKLARGGNITVNGNLVKDSSAHVSITDDQVAVNGIEVAYKEFVYLMLNKPAGYISATEDSRDTTVIDLVPEDFSHYELFPVGRLDKDTVGLLLLTNDGKLAHELLSPKKHVPKTYFVKVEGQVTDHHITLFKQGIVLDDGYKTKPADLTIISSDNISEVELTIMEGKFHQVKRMFADVDMKVIYLKRVSMGSLSLDEDLAEGDIRELTEEELSLLKKSGC